MLVTTLIAIRFYLKLLFSKNTGEIYGTQGIGKEGIDKRIDIISAAIKGNLTVE